MGNVSITTTKEIY